MTTPREVREGLPYPAEMDAGPIGYGVYIMWKGAPRVGAAREGTSTEEQR